MKVQNLKLADIHPYENNPRINKAAVADVAASIREFGWQQPIVVDKDHVIIAGHTRLLAAKELGLETAPVIVADKLSPAQVRAYRIMDNKAAEKSEWDYSLLTQELQGLQEAEFDVEMLGFDEEELEQLLHGDDPVTDGQTDPDAAPDVPETAVSESGKVYALGTHLLLCGDSTKGEDVATLMGETQADLWLTDPPYNVAYEGSNGLTIQNDSMSDASFREFLKTAFAAAKDHMKPGATFYVFHADSEGYNFRGALHDNDLKVRQCLIWKKNSLVLGRQDYQWVHEPCQPTGTKVLMEDGREKNIELLEDGDRVVSYNSYSGAIVGTRKGGFAIKTASRHYDGPMYTIEVAGRRTRATDNHKFSVRFKPNQSGPYRTYQIVASDLIPGIMQVPIPTDSGNIKWMPIDAIQVVPFEGTVYSLSVDRYGHYIADGIVTHNCLHGWKDGASHHWYGDRSQTTVMEFDKPKKNGDHPTMKPVEMLVYLMKNSSKRGDIVLDTFGGSGSTLIASEQTGRVCRMVELDPKYCDVIRRRWAEFVHGEGCDWQALTPEKA